MRLSHLSLAAAVVLFSHFGAQAAPLNCTAVIIEPVKMRTLVPSMMVKKNPSFLAILKAKGYTVHAIPWSKPSYEADENDIRRILKEDYEADLWLTMTMEAAEGQTEKDPMTSKSVAKISLINNDSDATLTESTSRTIPTLLEHEASEAKNKFLNELKEIRGPEAFQFLTLQPYFAMESAGHRYMKAFLDAASQLPDCKDLK